MLCSFIVDRKSYVLWEFRNDCQTECSLVYTNTDSRELSGGKGHKDRNRHENGIKESGQARLAYVKNINCNILITWRWAHMDPFWSFCCCCCYLFFILFFLECILIHLGLYNTVLKSKFCFCSSKNVKGLWHNFDDPDENIILTPKILLVSFLMGLRCSLSLPS